MIRAFAGVPLDAAYQERAGELRSRWQGRFASRMSWTKPGNWHLTLKFLGHVQDDKVDAVKQALSAVRFKPFTFQGGGCGFFPPKGRPRVFWLGLRQGAEECRSLAAQLEQALAPLGFEPERRPFSPHLTLARIKETLPGPNPWDKAMADVDAKPWPEVVQDRFVLWRSDLKPTGPVYTPLQEYRAGTA